MRTGTDSTRSGKTRKKAAKVPGVKSARKPVTRPSADAIQQTVIESHSQAAPAAVGELHSTETVLSGHFSSCNCFLISVT